MKGIEPSCAAWEAAVLPLNYTREEIFDFRFSIADCNRNKFRCASAVYANRCNVRCPSAFLGCEPLSAETADATAGDASKSLPRNHVIGHTEKFL